MTNIEREALVARLLGYLANFDAPYEMNAEEKQAADDLRALCAEVERLTRERDAYAKAKAENDERFMLERDAARAEVERLREALREIANEDYRGNRSHAATVAYHALRTTGGRDA